MCGCWINLKTGHSFQVILDQLYTGVCVRERFFGGEVLTIMETSRLRPSKSDMHRNQIFAGCNALVSTSDGDWIIGAPLLLLCQPCDNNNAPLDCVCYNTHSYCIALLISCPRAVPGVCHSFKLTMLHPPLKRHTWHENDVESVKQIDLCNHFLKRPTPSSN